MTALEANPPYTGRAEEAHCLSRTRYFSSTEEIPVSEEKDLYPDRPQDLSWDPYRVDVTNTVHPISPSTCSAAPAAAEVCSALLSRALPSFLQLLLSSLKCSFNFLPSAAQRFGS